MKRTISRDGTLGTLGASVLGNLLAGNGAIETSQGCKANMPG